MALKKVAEFGRTLVLAPHPDDETIGCGGLLALLAQAGQPVRVVLVTDGTGSHRRSLAYPAPRLRALRRSEMVAALAALGYSATTLSSLGLRDGHVPLGGEAGFASAVSLLSRITQRFAPDTVVMPAQDDHHADHRATQALGVAACAAAAPGARRLEYAVWGGRAAGPAAWQIDIQAVLHTKWCALALHRSQHGQVVHDDPHGFTLPQDVLDRCRAPVETYCERLNRTSDATL